MKNEKAKDRMKMRNQDAKWKSGGHRMFRSDEHFFLAK
jgi:hypothetical protein